jgi:hypothetical protein
MLVDAEGNYLMGGHTTGGEGVVNWDYLAIKVNSQTHEVEWRKSFGEPMGFDATGCSIMKVQNYLLISRARKHPVS